MDNHNPTLSDPALSYVNRVCSLAKEASVGLATLNSDLKNKFLEKLSQKLIDHQEQILAENRKDLQQGEENRLAPALIDRLLLTTDRIKHLSQSIGDIIALPDPVGEIVHGLVRPNGLQVYQERVPLGVVLAIYESRPNVSLDIASLCLKSGNAVILRGGKEAYHSNQILGKIIQTSLKEANLPENSVQMINRKERKIVHLLLEQNQMIDLVVPRGGEQLIQFISKHSQIPVIKHDKGLCHLYLDRDAPLDRATKLTLNSKVQRPGVCNAIETLLVHQDFPDLKSILKALKEERVELRLDPILQQDFPDHPIATEQDWSSEYLDLILSVKRVAHLEEAVDWINRYGSKHTEVIVTKNLVSMNYFKHRVDAACVIVNASSRFNDGSMLGLGAEVGISTQKLHVRGPMGIRDLTCLKFQLHGEGQIRT